ncbi:Probable peptidoglycan endopeptidase LytE precursor [Mycobacteroides abscessus subsp. abscessus]|nr:Probable peptidoglycan endopeptidase LytE precursor [Mycobacteroides abscessus subsp. abscessus]
MYDVKRGDTLWRISEIYKTTTEELKKINGLQTSLLLPGQKLRVPIMYEVKSGDTLWKLSQSFSSDAAAIKKVNRLASDRIYTGQGLDLQSEIHKEGRQGSAASYISAFLRAIQREQPFFHAERHERVSCDRNGLE